MHDLSRPIATAMAAVLVPVARVPSRRTCPPSIHLCPHLGWVVALKCPVKSVERVAAPLGFDLPCNMPIPTDEDEGWRGFDE
ncbi:hypothetical protein LMH87_010297 [Akanthomyces muscarius]|uniref:Uncharacterized protein n=1 Tax=Akanthomyces muscarius TaxID=2231603 RepID=A0A9W8QDH8_AKAMU|nr:hypothetical protein LMH87_010297 [Akanthomyces muscarius]KAJ4153826.1 hypothetical protein LMH87_010297 [Akanthomyces muscarius]